MSVTTPTKTANRVLQDWVSNGLATGNVQVGTELNVSAIFSAFISIQMVRGSGTAFTAGWPNVRIEASAKSSGTDSWVPIWEYQMAVGASIANTTLSANVSAGATSFTVAAATNIAVGDLLSLNNSTYSVCEIIRVKGVSGTTITPEEAVTNAYTNGDAVRDQAEVAAVQLDLSPYQRIRAVIDNAGSGQTMNARVLCSTLDSLSTT